MVECSKYESGTDALADFAIRNAISCVYSAQFGSAEMAGLLLMGMVGISLYIRTETVVMPWTVAMLTGSIVLPLVTAPAVALFILVIVGVGAGAPLVLYRRLEVRG